MKEIGEARDIEVGRYTDRVHIRGHPLEEAELVQALMKQGKSQGDIGKVLKLSQPQISKRLRLLTLPDSLKQKLKDGELNVSAAYIISKMPERVQLEFAKSKDKVTVKEAEQGRRDVSVSGLQALLNAPAKAKMERFYIGANTVEILTDGMGYFVKVGPFDIGSVTRDEAESIKKGVYPHG